jgi:predicted HAD superfamily Cof-like phosphohydrolase
MKKQFAAPDIFGVKSNHTNFSRVSDFMLAFGQYVRTKPKLDDSVSDLRFELIDEEVKELREAIDNQDLIEVADALTDILYVVYGAGHAYGIDLNECFEEVHRSNMSKLGEDGRPIYREDGKVLKGPNYFKPDLKKILYQHDD